MKQATIVKAAIVQLVHYDSEDAMYRIIARKVARYMQVNILSIERFEDGTVAALLQFQYNDKDMFTVSDLQEMLRNA